MSFLPSSRILQALLAVIGTILTVVLLAPGLVVEYFWMGELGYEGVFWTIRGTQVGLFFLVSLFFYAPRGAGVAGIEYPPAPVASGDVNFWSGVTNPSLFPELVQVTWERVADQYSEWFSPASEKATTTETGLVESFETFYESVDGHYEILLKALGFTAAPLLLFSAFGYALDRLGTGRYGLFVTGYGAPARFYEVGDDGGITDLADAVGLDVVTGGRSVAAGPILSDRTDVFVGADKPWAVVVGNATLEMYEEQADAQETARELHAEGEVPRDVIEVQYRRDT